MNIIERFTNPSKHVLEPYGTICRHGTQYFIQVSRDPETANWITFGELLEVCYQEFIKDEDYIKNRLMVYEMKNVQPESSLKE